ncbi:hypothetical protein HPB48_005744 [Haemaphysalis longicornis]|uniref:Transposase Tc1-like domain-containing protein n=1 Tax=Haemaphysalis longicornis TaxID=44386 RepID=A0A9J6FDU7_HAELO|nr:hypothetical protein HPB48_005744 [Haemaphysalis longicornis]
MRAGSRIFSEDADHELPQVSKTCNRGRRGIKASLTSKQIKCELDLSASTKTVRRRLHDVRLRNCVPARKPKLSEANKLARLLFAEDHATWTAEDWSCVLFTDESTFSSRWDQRQRIWRAVNTRYE